MAEREGVCRQQRGRAQRGGQRRVCAGAGSGGEGTGEGGHVRAAGREWCMSGDGGRGNVLVSRVKGWREWIHT